LLQALADAVVVGDHERARLLAEELRVLEAAPIASLLRRAR
jgi:predicted nicotinamide N-methyase